MGCAQRRVSPLRRLVVELCPLCDHDERLHCGGPQVEVAVMAGDNDLGIAEARWHLLQDGVLGRHPVRFVQQHVAVVRGGPGKPEWVLGVVPAHARAVLKPLQGHLVDCLRRARGDPCGLLVVRMPQEVEDDLRVHCMDPRPVDAIL